ncbi:MAG: tyrosine-type recombinase/integrase [Sarcina sp.]
MICITEKKRENKSIFEINSYDLRNKLLYTEELVFETSIKQHSNGMTYLLLYNDNMVPLNDVFHFLNIHLATLSINSRIKALNALRLLTIFEKIHNKPISDFNKSDINLFKSFLRGHSPKGQIISFDVLTQRSAQTINGYLAVYRNYLSFLGIKDSPFFERSSTYSIVSDPLTDMDYQKYNYSINEKMPTPIRQVPKYISTQEFATIISELHTNYSIPTNLNPYEECIIRLMYEAGLRLGEVLGLTGEDLVCEFIDGKPNFLVYIRNRFTDRKDQNAKGCMKITNRKQYHSSAYSELRYGFQIVSISKDLYELIETYIENSHALALERHEQNYQQYTIADTVTTSKMFDGDNYYIFLNSQGKPLSYQTWNNKLRTIYSTVGIHIDSKNRKNNLSHRFRHGFAMYNVQYLHLNLLELQIAMRHKSSKSTLVYFNPTLSEQIQLKTDFLTDL